jgi:RimJ/RimL family protein N-acetyltransferase
VNQTPDTNPVDFNAQPVLEDDLVRIRPLEAADLEPLYAVASDPLIWEQHPAKRYQREIYEGFFTDSIASGGALAIIDNATGEIIGSSRYIWLDGVTRAIEIGYSFLARSHWGGKYNGAVKALMLDHAFDTFDCVIFYIATQNVRSRRAVEKIGGEQIFIEDYPDVVKKSDADVTYQILRDHWRQLTL